MANSFENLVNDMVNIGFGAAAMAAEKSRAVLDDLSAKGEEVRRDPQSSDFTRSMSDIFERAGGTFSDVTSRLSSQGETAAERILDELIVARLRQLDAGGRAAFVSHVADLSRAVDMETVDVTVETVEVEEDASAADENVSEEQKGE